MLLIVCGPSGVGKSRLLDVAERSLGFRRIVPLTTRSIRDGEKAGIDYTFISKTDFRQMITDDALSAWDYVLGNYYGYAKDLVECIESDHNTVIQALSRMALRIASSHSNVLLVSLRPNSEALLENRLTERHYCQDEFIMRRAHWAEETELSHLFNVVIENADMTQTSELAATLAEIINRFA